MILKKTLITALLFNLLVTNVVAKELVLTQNEVRNLGIDTAVPELAQELVILEATARVVIPPLADTMISAPEAGMLTNLAVSEGDKVTSGQLIAQLRSANFVSLQRELLEASYNAELAKAEFDRDQTLYQEGIISARRLQETSTHFKVTTASLNEHRQLLNVAGMSPADIDKLEKHQMILQVLGLYAPFDGVILERMANVGQRLRSMDPIFRLADVSSLWLEIDVPQEKLRAVEPGMKVALADVQIQPQAIVTTIGSAVDSATQTVMVRASLGVDTHDLRPNQFVSAVILADVREPSTEAVWTVPVQAVIGDGQSHFLFVRTQSGFESRQAELIGADETDAYLNIDIDRHTRIAISGIAALKAIWSAQNEPEA